LDYSIQYSTKSGLGKPALEVYLYGCDKPIKCNGCHNKELLETPSEFTPIKQIEEHLLREISNFSKFHKQVIISFVGGEPTADHNKERLNRLSGTVKSKYVDSLIVLYSWKRLDGWSINNFKHIDYGVLGEYISELHVDNYIPSSSNQIIYDFKNHEIMDNINLNIEKENK